jgi:hypothetical protein
MTMPTGVWIAARTALDEVYPCRCDETRGSRAGGGPHAAYCACAGRLDPQGPACCASRNTPAVTARAVAEEEARRATRAVAAKAQLV